MVDIVKYCEFQPIYIQQFLFDLWRSPTFDSDALEKIKHSILTSHQNQFMVLWDLLTQNQKKTLRLLTETAGEGIYAAEQLQKVGFNSGSVLHTALLSLQEKGIIFKNKTFKFQDAMFKKWVQGLCRSV